MTVYNDIFIQFTGFLIYFTYGIRHSVEGNYDERIPLTTSSAVILDDNEDDFIEEYHDDDDDNDESTLIWMRSNAKDRVR